MLAGSIAERYVPLVGVDNGLDMRCHDYHLSRYEVADGGKTVVLHLVRSYPGEEIDRSRITFHEVAFYNFIHTDGAIITDIDEISIQEFIAECGEQLKEWDRKYGLRLFENLDSYAETLQNSRYKVWRVESAIGFWGLVVAREVKNT